MARPFKTNRRDTKPIRMTLQKESPVGSGTFIAVDLTGGTVRFLMRDPGSGAQIVGAPATVIDAPNGIVEYGWGAGGTAAVGVFQAQWEITYSGGIVESVPDGGYVSIVVQDDLG
jgi:hypothetical protein